MREIKIEKGNEKVVRGNEKEKKYKNMLKEKQRRIKMEVWMRRIEHKTVPDRKAYSEGSGERRIARGV